ncbi:hypothetical protein [Paraburkholderia graminis]
MATKLQIDPQKLLGFAPDLDPATPGIFQTCNNVVPTLIGFKGAPSPVNAGLPALASPALGSALIARLDGTDRQFAGTSTHMYENVSGTWVDRSKAGGYTLGTSAQWRFAAFGNESLAVNGGDVMQVALDGGFTNVPVSLQAINITAQGAGYTSAPTVTVGAPNIVPGVQATATAITSGTIATVTVTGGGAGYAYAPNVAINGGGGDGSAQIQANISAGVVSILPLPGQAGSGYTSAPTVSITGGGGSGAAALAIIGTTATATATIASGAVTAVTLAAGPWSTANTALGQFGTTLAGAGYTAVPTVTFSAPASGVTATGTAVVCLMPGGYYTVCGINITAAGSGYTVAPTVTISAPTTVGQVVGFSITNPGSAYNAAPSIVLNGGGFVTQASVACDICGVVTSTTIVDSGAAFTSAPTLSCTQPQLNGASLSGSVSGGVLKNIAIVFPGTGFATAPTITITGGGATTSATATCTIGAGGFINKVTITGAGAGYTSAPTITVSPQPTAATATATMTCTTVQSLTAINITNPGAGYTSAPTVTLSGGGVSDTAQGKATAQIVQAPVGKVVFVANGQVFVCNCSLPSVVAGGNYWFASGIYDHTQWDYTNEQNLCAYGPLIDTPGGITAGTSLGPNAIIFKSNSMYFGQQTGYPIGWQFEAVSKNIGAPCQEAVVNAGSSLFFIGPDDFYAYQGNGLPQPIGQNVRRWFFNTLNPSYKDKISSFYDQDQRVIYWAFVSNNSLSGALDTCISYNWTTQTWGVMNTSMQGFVQVLNGQITYNSMGTEWVHWADLPNISYNSSFWINFRVTPGYFDSTNTLQALAGTSTGSTITTNTFGDDTYYSTMQQFKLRFKQLPQSGSSIWQGMTTEGTIDASAITSNPTGPFVVSDARIDVDYNARWHNLILKFNGDYELIQWYPMMVKTGRN